MASRSSADDEKALLLKDTDVEGKPIIRDMDASNKNPIFAGLGYVSLVIGYYAACSSTMLVINKVAIHNLPCPTFVLCIQLAASAAVAVIGSKAGWLNVDKIEWEKLRRFIWVIIGFLGTIFANIKVLQHANVETFITFRSSTPLVLSICDYLYLGRALPSRRSWACLLVLLAGSVGYVLTDSDYQVRAYFWLVLWYAFFTFDCVYAKHMCETVKMTNWGRVYYTNVIALPPLLVALPFLGEHLKIGTVSWTPAIVLPLALSCVVGTCMSHASYLLRDAVSATLFTIVGILCKVITVIINVMIWDKHASASGIGFLMLCVLAGTFYEQAPRRG